MGLKDASNLRQTFRANVVEYSRVAMSPHVIDASGVFYGWLAGHGNVAAARAAARAMPAKLRRDFSRASEFHITTDAATPPNKKTEHAARGVAKERAARNLGIDLAEEIRDVSQLPGTLRTSAIAATLAQRAMPLAQLLAAHANDPEIAVAPHGAPWDAVLLPFAIPGLIRVAIAACRDDGMQVIDDPALSPEGEVGAVSFVRRSKSKHIVLVGNDSDFFVAFCVQGDDSCQMYYYDLTLAKTKQVYDVTATLVTMSMEERRRRARNALFVGCDYIHWECKDPPTDCRLYALFTGTRAPKKEAAMHYMNNAPDWFEIRDLVQRVRLRYPESGMQFLRTEWAMAHYGGTHLDITKYGWAADGTPLRAVTAAPFEPDAFEPVAI